MTSGLRPAEDFREQAASILTSQKVLLVQHRIRGQLVHVGGTSVAGALTRGDVDLHLRVAPEDFSAVVAAASRIHTVTKPEIWCSTLATFDVEAELPTGLAVTPRGSEHDLRFTRTWALIAADPTLLALYNETKLRASAENYETCKSEFVDRVLTLWKDG